VGLRTIYSHYVFCWVETCEKTLWLSSQTFALPFYGWSIQREDWALEEFFSWGRATIETELRNQNLALPAILIGNWLIFIVRGLFTRLKN